MRLVQAGRRGIVVSIPRRFGMRALGSSSVVLACVLTIAGCDSARSAPTTSPRPSAGSASADDSYGALPTFLPSAAVRPNSTLTGNAARPALTVEGDTVRAVLASGARVSVVVSGPVVPGEGLPHATGAPTCTWTVTLRAASGSVPISVDAFNTLDHLGHIYRLAYVPGQPRPPAVLTPGRTTSFELRAVMPTGEGLMRWAPDGRHILASWDFEVEND